MVHQRGFPRGSRTCRRRTTASSIGVGSVGPAWQLGLRKGLATDKRGFTQMKTEGEIAPTLRLFLYCGEYVVELAPAVPLIARARFAESAR